MRDVENNAETNVSYGMNGATYYLQMSHTNFLRTDQDLLCRHFALTKLFQIHDYGIYLPTRDAEESVERSCTKYLRVKINRYNE